MASFKPEEMPVLERENALVPGFRRNLETPESGIVLENTELTEQGETEKTMTSLSGEETNRDAIPPSHLYNFNLANPEEITRMLETVDLTDEDADVLLQEAYNINKKLKEILRRREEGIELDPSEEAILNGQTIVVVPGSGLQPRANTADAAVKGRDPAFSKAEALPPIKSSDNNADARVASAIYSAKLGRRPVPPSGLRRTKGALPPSHPPSGVHRSPPSAMSRGSRNTSSVGGRKSGRVMSGKVRKKEVAPIPIEERPAWNDRFSV